MAHAKRRIRVEASKKRTNARRQEGNAEGGKAKRAPAKGAIAVRQRSTKTASAGRRAAGRPAAKRGARQAAERHALAVFDQQIGPLWDRLVDQCRQFAHGFNQEVGANQLQVESNPAGLMVRLPADGAEAFFQLDTSERHFAVAMSTGCTSFGSCITDQAPVGLAILDGQLRFLFGGRTISEEDLAVRILTDLIEADAPKASAETVR